MSDELTVQDYNGSVIRVGTPVRYFDYGPDHPDWGQDAKYIGVVSEISDWDADADEAGRHRDIPPYVSVVFGAGEEAEFATSGWEFRYVGGEPMADEIPETIPYGGMAEELVVDEKT
jgi:hypothetical protein